MNGNIQVVAGLLQVPLREVAAGGHRAHAQADLQTRWQRGLFGGIRADLAQILVHQVFEDRMGLLEAIGGNVGQIVGNHIQLGLLGFHAGLGYPERVNHCVLKLMESVGV